MTTRTEILDDLDFGSVNSEFQDDLDELFVRTDSFDQFMRPRTWLALGPKGTGKSAIFDLLVKYDDKARLLAPQPLEKVIVLGATGRGDDLDIDAKDLSALSRLSREFDHQEFWNLYIALQVALALKDLDFGDSELITEFLRNAGLANDRRIASILKKVWRKFIGSQPPKGKLSNEFVGELEFGDGEPTIDPNQLLREADEILEQNDREVWVIFDKIDELWPGDRPERNRSIESLMVEVVSIRRRFKRIQPKILLRSDIWAELSFTNKDHWNDKRINLEWSSEQISDLLLKRALRSPLVFKHATQALEISEDLSQWAIEERETVFRRIFPPTAYSGGNEADIKNWITERVKDGQGTVLPRDAIVLSQQARDRQKSIEDGLVTREESEEAWLISRPAVREGFVAASRFKVETFLTEFPEIKQHLSHFDGFSSDKVSRTTMRSWFENYELPADEAIQRLFDIGLLTPIGKKMAGFGSVSTVEQFEIPKLYRTGLGLVRPGRL